MKLVTKGESTVVIELTKRNLRTLLAGMEQEGTYKIALRDSDGVVTVVYAVPDSDHYAERHPGYVPPDMLV